MGTRRVSSLSPSWKRRLLLLRGAVPSTPAHNESMLGSAPPSPHPSTHVIHSHGFWQFASNRGKSFPFYTVTHFIRLKGGPYYSVRYIYCIHSGQMSNKYTHIATTSNDVIFVNYFYPHSLLIYPLEGLDPLPTMYYYQWLSVAESDSSSNQ